MECSKLKLCSYRRACMCDKSRLVRYMVTMQLHCFARPPARGYGVPDPGRAALMAHTGRGGASCVMCFF